MTVEQQTQHIDPATVRNNRIKLLLVVALFVAPVAVAMYMYYSGWRPSATMNHGTLVQPARPAPNVSFSDNKNTSYDQHVFEQRWNLVVAVNGTCNESCKKNLYAIRQIQIAQGKNQHRIRRILIHTGVDTGIAEIAASYPELVILQTDAGTLAPLRTWLETGAPKHDLQGAYVYMIDPLGNYMMYYSPGYDPTGLRKDLVRLLRVSHIG